MSSNLEDQKFRRSLDIAPENDTTWYNLAFVFVCMTRYKDLITYFEKAININLNNIGTRENLKKTKNYGIGNGNKGEL